MSTVGRLKQGDLLLAGEIEERVPTVRKGLVTHFPFDHTEKGRSFRNLLDPSSWTVGTTGSGNGWSMNGNNLVTTHMTPFEYEDTVLSVTVPDTVSGYEGGWTNYSHVIDNTKLYRLSVWIRREDVGDGRTYFGCQGSSVCNLGTTTVNTNPYFSSKLVSNIPQIENNWTLWVAYIHPHDYTGSTHPDTGIYTLDGTKISTMGDFKWNPTATTGGHRSYLYYSTSMGEKQYWYAPRMEMAHGSESTIAELLKGWDDFYSTAANEYVTFTDKGAGIEYSTTNMATGTVGVYGGYHSHVREGQKITFTMIGDNKPLVFNIGQSLTGKTFAISGYMKQNGVPAFVNTRASTYNVLADNKKLHFDPETGYFEIVEYYSHATSTWVMHASTSFKDGDKITIEELQVEERNYGTSFTPSSRSGNGLLRIDNLGGFTDYTVFGTFYPRTPLDATYNFTSSSASIFRIEDVVNTGGFYYRYYVSGTNSGPYMDNDGVYGGSHNHQYFNVAANKDLMYAVTKSGTTVRMKLYQDGTLLGEHVNTTASAIARLDSIILGGTTIWNGSHKNISVYNRVLADAEITKLAKGSFSISKEGGLLSSVKEYDSIMLIEEESRNVADNTYGSTGTWAVAETDISRFVEANNELGTVYFTGEVYLSSVIYPPRSFEFTKDNNTKGINQTVIAPNGGWKVGWNTIFFKANSYVDALNTPWADMSRLEIYRDGPTAGSDTTQYFTLKNIQLVKVDEYGKWMRNQNNKLYTIQIKEGKVL